MAQAINNQCPPPGRACAWYSPQLLRRRDPMIDTYLVQKSEKETMRIVLELMIRNSSEAGRFAKVVYIKY